MAANNSLSGEELYRLLAEAAALKLVTLRCGGPVATSK